MSISLSVCGSLLCGRRVTSSAKDVEDNNNAKDSEVHSSVYSVASGIHHHSSLSRHRLHRYHDRLSFFRSLRYCLPVTRPGKDFEDNDAQDSSVHLSVFSAFTAFTNSPADVDIAFNEAAERIFDEAAGSLR